MKLIRLLVLSSVFAAVSYAGGAGCPCTGKSDTAKGDKAPAPTTEQSKG